MLQVDGAYGIHTMNAVALVFLLGALSSCLWTTQGLLLHMCTGTTWIACSILALSFDADIPLSVGLLEECGKGKREYHVNFG